MNIKIFDFCANSLVSLERNKWLSDTLVFLLIQTYLESYQYCITYISTKISKSLGILAKLRHTVPSNILLNMCQSHTALLVLWYGCLGPSCLDKFEKNLGSAKTCPLLDYFKPRYIDSMLFKLLNVLPHNLRTLFENNLHDVFNN